MGITRRDFLKLGGFCIIEATLSRNSLFAETDPISSRSVSLDEKLRVKLEGKGKELGQVIERNYDKVVPEDKSYWIYRHWGMIRYVSDKFLLIKVNGDHGFYITDFEGIGLKPLDVGDFVILNGNEEERINVNRLAQGPLRRLNESYLEVLNYLVSSKVLEDRTVRELDLKENLFKN